MRIINIAAINEKQQQALEPKAVVIVRRSKPPQVKAHDDAPRQETSDRTRPQLLAQLDEQVLEIRRERNKVSNRARERWKAGADEKELANLYDNINAFTEELQKLWDKRQHVEKYGTLPLEAKAQNFVPRQESADVAIMKLEKKKLEEKKSKLRKKLAPNAKSPYNSARRMFWQEELDRTEALWNELNQKIKQMSYESGS